MGKEEIIKSELISSIIDFVRSNYAEVIDKAYEYFWDEYKPDEFMAGTALELGFINFEDWLIFNYKVNENKESFIDLFVQRNRDLTELQAAILKNIKGSLLSLFEVVSVSRDKRVLLKDLLLGGEFSLRNKALTRGLGKGDLFATRLLPLDKGYVMSGCVYPYTSAQKKQVLNYIDKQFSRFKRNVNPAGTMRDYLGDYGDVFNLVWMSFILERMKHQE
ncbi:MAG: hypothetical protein HZA17_02845 [Nitrospirae bacterium]|nr:hypothetical protein [Nitrospirota bacterium]